MCSWLMARLAVALAALLVALAGASAGSASALTRGAGATHIVQFRGGVSQSAAAHVTTLMRG